MRSPLSRAALLSAVPTVLRVNRDFRMLFLAEAGSSIGTAVTTLAFPLLVLSIGGSAVQAGSIATVTIGTRMLCRLPAGGLIDRANPRSVMVATDLVRFGAVGSIPLTALLTATPSFAHLIAVAAVEGTAAALFGPAAAVMTKDVTTRDELAEALGLGQAVLAAAGLAGPALGGALFMVNPMLPFVVDTVSYAASALWLWQVRARPGPAQAGVAGVTAGIRWLLGAGPLLIVLVYAGLINLVSAAIEVMVVLDLQARGVPGGVIGLILSCSGAGAIVGALLAPAVTRRAGVRTILLGIGCVWTATLVTFAIVFAPWVVGVLLAVLMLLSPAAGVVVGSALLTTTPRHLLGRVSAATSVLLTGLSALGPIGAGILVQGLGPARGWWCLAAVTAVVTMAFSAPLRAAGRPDCDDTPAATPAPSSFPAAPLNEVEEFDVVAHEFRPDPMWRPGAR